jgi:hypothetical protein
VSVSAAVLLSLGEHPIKNEKILLSNAHAALDGTTPELNHSIISLQLGSVPEFQLKTASLWKDAVQQHPGTLSSWAPYHDFLTPHVDFGQKNFDTIVTVVLLDGILL